MERFKVIWTEQAKKELKRIYDYYKEQSLQGAKNVRSDLLQSPKTIYFSKQYQVDDINPNYRRIIVRNNYKVLYREESENIKVMDIVSSKQSPDILKNK
jgi:addiction module RelE/StbE family toxin